MRFKVDENLPTEVARALRDSGWDTFTIEEQQLSSADDERVQTVCDSEDRILVTFDRGFSDTRTHAPDMHPGFVVFRLRSQAKRHVLQATDRLIAALRERELRNELWIVEESRIRIRFARVR